MASVAAQGLGYLAYEISRPAAQPSLTLHLIGDGHGQILITAEGSKEPLARCVSESSERARLRALPIAEAIGPTARYLERLRTDVDARNPTSTVIRGGTCRVEVPAGKKIRLLATLEENSAFGGYRQYPMRTPLPLRSLLGDPLGKCSYDEVSASDVRISDVRDCTIALTASTAVSIELSRIGGPVELEIPTIPDALRDPKTLVAKVAKVPPIDAEKLEELVKPLAVPPPKPPPDIPPPQVPPPPQPKPKDKTQPPPVNMVMVEVKDDKSVVDKEVDADKLSDKNRDVEQETRADQTNLQKESEGKQVASTESDRKDPEIGGPDDKIRQLEQAEATSDQRIDQTDHSGRDDSARGVIVGQGGEDGEDGQGEQPPGLLSMRGIGGRGALQEQGRDGKQGKRGTPGINTPLSFQDYERILGKDKVDTERHVAAKAMSAKKGRYERKLEAIRSSLENFVPDVRVGNQTALKTRAHPFAVYVARMHRRIHELWGFGFLEHLDDKGHDHPLNNQDLWTNLEVSLNPDGTVHKVTIVKTSGKTEFDVAAVDTVLTSAPYEATPEAIRSSDDRVYLRWAFYRNWRQCGTFNVEPYILTDIPKDSGTGVLDDGAMVRNTARTAKRTGGTPITPDDGKTNQRVSPATSVTDKEAVFVANMWVSGFATASIDKLVKYSIAPFYAGGQIAAQTTADLKDLYTGLVVESGKMTSWKLLSPNEYPGGDALPAGNLILQVTTAKAAFAIILTKTKSGDYRAAALAR